MFYVDVIERVGISKMRRSRRNTERRSNQPVRCAIAIEEPQKEGGYPPPVSMGISRDHGVEEETELLACFMVWRIFFFFCHCVTCPRVWFKLSLLEASCHAQVDKASKSSNVTAFWKSKQRQKLDG